MKRHQKPVVFKYRVLITSADSCHVGASDLNPGCERKP